MNSWDLLQAVQATTVLLSDEPLATIDTTFFHARAWEDDDGLFLLTSQLYHSHKTNSIAINGGEGGLPGSTIGGQNWPGWKHYVTKLQVSGVRGVDICVTDPAKNTKEENEMFLMLAMQKEWRSAVIIGQPHHILREFLGMIASMRDHAYWMRIYAAAPRTVDWTKLVYGSPSVLLTPRLEHIFQELERIPRYQAKGDLAQYNELYSYLGIRSLITRTWSPTEHPVQ